MKVARRLKYGRQVFGGRLRTICNSSMSTKKMKVRLFNSLVKPVVVHGCETRKMTEGDK